MSFVTALALAMGLLVLAPYLAHRLRRQRAEERPFAPARLVPSTPPKARRRSRLEDRALFGVRGASILLLALLGASPLVKCSRLALSRGGASVAVAIVLDDSMSMRAEGANGATRFARAKKGAEEIFASLREGDAAAIVLAGAPVRVGLAATTDISAARVALESVVPSDRATDLDGAIAIAKTLVSELPQVDRRVIVLSDLADGKPDAPPLGEGAGLPVWVAMPDLAGPAEDCGILGADRSGGRARIRFACTSQEAARGREVQIKDGDQILAATRLPESALGEASLVVNADDTKELVAVLTGKDAIASDDRALVVVESGPAALAVVSDSADETVATGGAPVVEQALGALHIDMAVRPIPQAPDRREDAAPFAAIVVDDAPGFTPEQRHALASFVDRGGVLFLALGPRSASAPLGASFEPFLSHGVTFGPSPVNGADPASGASALGEGAASLADLSPKGRAKLNESDAAAFEPWVKWTDGALLIGRRPRGRGEVWVATLPLSPDASDFPLRPGFLALLDTFVTEARQHSAPRRADVGTAWLFPGAGAVTGEGPSGAVKTTRDEGVLRVVPALAGTYRLAVDGNPELRVASPVAREIDMRPRTLAASATSSGLGGGVSVVDISWAVALGLLALVAIELVLRVMTKPREETA